MLFICPSETISLLKLLTLLFAIAAMLSFFNKLIYPV
jgi:hypothetical protein